MATLVLESFKCYEETDEVGNDSPYFVFFVGRPAAPKLSKLTQIRQSHWDNDVSDSSGFLYQPGATVATKLGPNALVLCALMEEDDNPDIVPGNEAFTNIQTKMRTKFAEVATSGASVESQANTLRPTYITELNARVTNDDVINVQHIPLNIDLKKHGSFAFNGDGGQYQVWFRQAPD